MSEQSKQSRASIKGMRRKSLTWATYILAKGKHFGLKIGDDHKSYLKPGDAIELNERQAKSFGDKFVAQSVYEAQVNLERAKIEAIKKAKEQQAADEALAKQEKPALQASTTVASTTVASTQGQTAQTQTQTPQQGQQTQVSK